MPTFRNIRGRRAVWLLIPLLVLAAGGRSICWCAEETGHRPDSGSEEPLASCHGQDLSDEDLALGTEHDPSAPCGPSHECCCADNGTLAVKAPESPALDQHAASALAAAPFAYVLPTRRRTRAATVRLRPPRGPSPPLFVVNCTFRC